MAAAFPDEILFNIFKDLDFNQLLKCQQVCRSWYTPAHIKLLKEVELTSDSAINQFIASFEDNPNVSYFKAVKIMRIDRRDPGVGMIPERDTIEKLFFRFPNLEYVKLDHSNMVVNFDEELCKTFLLRCPKLEDFKIIVDDQDPDLVEDLAKVRPLLTLMYLPNTKHQPNLVDPVQYISQFPRLKNLYFEDSKADSFGKFLPFFEKVSNVTSLTLGLGTDDEENSGERYLTIRPKELQDQIKERLSNIKSLFIYPYNDIGIGLKFVSDYFTGLTYFAMERDLSDWEPSTKQDLFCENLYDLIPSVNGICDIDLNNMHIESLWNNFPSLIQNMFERVPPYYEQQTHRRLKVDVGACYYGEPDIIHLVLKSTQHSRDVQIRVQEDIDVDSLALHMSQSEAPMKEIDEFVLQLPIERWREPYEYDINADQYLKLLEPMKFLQRIELGVPATFEETQQQENQSYDGPHFPDVGEVIITATFDGSFQSLLDRCAHAFPSVHYLEFKEFSGIWKANIGEFQLYLPDYLPEILVLDTFPVENKLEELEIPFFVVEIEIRSRG